MGLPAVGAVVLAPFPYVDFSGYKKRPALVLAYAEFGNIIVCQITSKAATSTRAVRLGAADFRKGGLQLTSFVRPDKLSTLDLQLIQAELGEISSGKLKEIKGALRRLLDV